jgi:hypothetical protein
VSSIEGSEIQRIKSANTRTHTHSRSFVCVCVCVCVCVGEQTDSLVGFLVYRVPRFLDFGSSGLDGFEVVLLCNMFLKVEMVTLTALVC